ncbi:MAG TPA: HAMP domain-containing sensor histidine kinase [Vicinamibacterales bacterium]|nr:HAMP domain-containing sensor histidine kinase [Vicinamibacterales bacterium]
MTPLRSRQRLHYVLAVVWLSLTVSLAAWWLVFGLSQARRLHTATAPADTAEIDRVQRMLEWEGIFLIALLVGGGIALIVGIRREHARQDEVSNFFMSFTHDLKTSLASLQLQAESLREDLPEAADNANLERLMKDARRLQLQLENSLYFAQPDGGLIVEPVDVHALVERVAEDWPELEVRTEGERLVLADERGVTSVMRNLLQNASVHGQAREVVVRIEPVTHGRVAITVTDDGRGVLEEEVAHLGQPFVRSATTGGSGVGLFVSRRLLSRMRGSLQCARADRGLRVTLELPEAR